MKSNTAEPLNNKIRRENKNLLLSSGVNRGGGGGVGGVLTPCVYTREDASLHSNMQNLLF